MDEFICSLRLAFPQVIDVNYLLKDIGPVKKMTNISATIAYLKNRFFAPIEMEIPNQGQSVHTCTSNHCLHLGIFHMTEVHL